MVGSVHTSESETTPPNLSPASSSSSTNPKAVIDNLCTHVAGTTLAGHAICPDRRPSMQSQNVVANPVQARPPAASHSPGPLPLPLPPLSFGDPMELCGSEEEECKTPRGEEYRIPEPLTCPPAPKRSRPRWSERRVCFVGKEEEEEEKSVDSSEVQEALEKMR